MRYHEFSLTLVHYCSVLIREIKMSLKNMIYPPFYTPHSTNIFTPMEIEKILDTTLTKDNCRFYKVKWVRISWETESELAFFNNIIDEFWAQYTTDENLIVGESNLIRQNDILSSAEPCQSNEKLDLVDQSFSNAEVIESQIKEMCSFQNLREALESEVLTQNENTVTVSQNEKEINDTTCGEGNSLSSKDDDKSKMKQSNNEVSENKFLCNKCGKVLTNQANYEKHYSSHKLKICNICKKEFTRMAHLQAHQEIHRNERPYKCDKCNKGFNDKTTLKKHKLIHTERSYSCNHCQKRFQRKEHLKRHISSIHENIRNHDCQFCGKSFHEKNTLLSHLNIHLGVKKHTCSDCGKSFTERSTLNNHKTCHLSNKPFKCNTCYKQFTRKATLKMHMKKHEPVT